MKRAKPRIIYGRRSCGTKLHFSSDQQRLHSFPFSQKRESLKNIISIHPANFFSFAFARSRQTVKEEGERIVLRITRGLEFSIGEGRAVTSPQLYSFSSLSLSILHATLQFSDSQTIVFPNVPFRARGEREGREEEPTCMQIQTESILNLFMLLSKCSKLRSFFLPKETLFETRWFFLLVLEFLSLFLSRKRRT